MNSPGSANTSASDVYRSIERQDAAEGALRVASQRFCSLCY
jgi:hypothetical protein